MLQWFDTHTHIDITEKDTAAQQELVEKSLNSNISGLVNVSVDFESYLRGKNLNQKNLNKVFCTAGLYPSWSEKYDASLKIKLKEQLKEGIAIAMGECGLDYHWNYGTPDLQKQLFRDQIHLAKEFNLPIIIHARDAYEDVYDILKEEKHFGIMHCFGGDADIALKFIDIGFYISFAGNTTYKKAVNLHEAAKAVPLECLLLETDAPYLTPVPFRGKKNYPALIEHTAQFIANLKEISLEKINLAANENAKKIFRLN